MQNYLSAACRLLMAHLPTTSNLHPHLTLTGTAFRDEQYGNTISLHPSDTSERVFAEVNEHAVGRRCYPPYENSASKLVPRTKCRDVWRLCLLSNRGCETACINALPNTFMTLKS
jgi:hypothetical protein